MKVEKGEQGYISKRKKIDTIWLLVFIAIGVGIFLTGCMIFTSRANVLTVLAVLMVLPGAKRVVALIVLLPRKGVSKERYQKAKEVCGDGVLYTDYVFTSTEKIMHLDFLLVKNGNVLALIAPSKQDVDYMKKYMTQQVSKLASDYGIKFFTKDEDFLKYAKKVSDSGEEGQKEALLEFLHASIV